jgi:hypothetical protein
MSCILLGFTLYAPCRVYTIVTQENVGSGYTYRKRSLYADADDVKDEADPQRWKESTVWVGPMMSVINFILTGLWN